MDSKILIVDDDPDILEFLGYNLTQAGYKVETAPNGAEGIIRAKEFLPDLILLDIMMPEMDGIKTCMTLRQIPAFDNTVIAFLTARDEDFTQVSGFEAGGDDYITKPIRPKVLISRINALLRRQEKTVEEKNLIHIDDNLTIDKTSYLVYYMGEAVNFPRKEFELLYFLASKPGKVFKREEIYRHVWGPDIIVGNRTIDVHIRKIREKLDNQYIRTVKGVGYRFDF